MLQAVKAGLDVVICDTSGRLHTNVGLMEELAKCKRAITKRLPGAPHEVLLVLDGTTGAHTLPFLVESAVPFRKCEPLHALVTVGNNVRSRFELVRFRGLAEKTRNVSPRAQHAEPSARV